MRIGIVVLVAGEGKRGGNKLLVRISGESATSRVLRALNGLDRVVICWYLNQ